MAPESLNGVLHKSLPSVFVSVCVSLICLLGKGSVKCIPPFIARQLLGKHVPAATNTRNIWRIAGRVCLWVCLCIPLLLLGNNSVKTFTRQRRIVGGVVFYAVRVVPKESRRLVFPRTYCSCKYVVWCHWRPAFWTVHLTAVSERRHLCRIFAKLTAGVCTTSMTEHPLTWVGTLHRIWVKNSLADGSAVEVRWIGYGVHRMSAA
jgi:hypothetical protein